MKWRGNLSTTETRAIECALVTAVALFAADGIRTALRPSWAILKMLFGA